LNLLNEPGGAAELRAALEAIERRVESLSSFVGTYRQLSRWPPPVVEPVDLQGLFNGMNQAVGAAWSARGGEAQFELGSPSLRLLADEGQLEQVLLALFHNAEQATADVATPPCGCRPDRVAAAACRSQFATTAQVYPRGSSGRFSAQGRLPARSGQSIH
jgi:nitrogen fixation/metabolism regulation signal transduction histidine kinase